MLVKLSARGLQPLGEVSSAPFVARVTDGASGPGARDVLLATPPVSTLPSGYRGYLVHERCPASGLRGAYVLGVDHRYVQPGDVVRIDPAGRRLTALHRAGARVNTFLLTERCDNFCVMCSQPPKAADDSWLVDEVEDAIPLVSPDTAEIGLSGGEPALLGSRLVRLVALLRDHLPRTAVHVLSNGRRFSDATFARELGAVEHPDLMIGVPLYGDLPEVHDYVVQAHGAFDETIRGVLNLKRYGVRVELRFVVHRETVARLRDFSRFVARNLTFVDHVAVMGLELVGFARSNLDQLWIDPVDYQAPLADAVLGLDRAGMSVSIYNHPLCVTDRRLWPFARKSISEWKNLYFTECGACARRDECGGFFASSTLRRTRGIRPFPANG